MITVHGVKLFTPKGGLFEIFCETQDAAISLQRHVHQRCCVAIRFSKLLHTDVGAHELFDKILTDEGSELRVDGVTSNVRYGEVD